MEKENKIALKNIIFYIFSSHFDIMKSITFLLYIIYKCLLYYCTTIYVCSCLFVIYLCFTHIYICCYSQYSLMRKIQFYTLLCILCTRLLYTFMRLMHTLIMYICKPFNNYIFWMVKYGHHRFFFEFLSEKISIISKSNK